MDMKCMSHRTKNRMKPKTANPCMASSRTAMATGGGNQGGVTQGRERADRPPSGSDQKSRVSKRPTRLACFGRKFGVQRQEPDPLWRSGDMDTEASRGLVVLLLSGHGTNFTDLSVTRPTDGQLTKPGERWCAVRWIATTCTPLPAFLQNKTF